MPSHTWGDSLVGPCYVQSPLASQPRYTPLVVRGVPPTSEPCVTTGIEASHNNLNSQFDAPSLEAPFLCWQNVAVYSYPRSLACKMGGTVVEEAPRSSHMHVPRRCPLYKRTPTMVWKPTKPEKCRNNTQGPLTKVFFQYSHCSQKVAGFGVCRTLLNGLPQARPSLCDVGRLCCGAISVVQLPPA